MESVGWLITPAFIATILFTVLPFYDPGIRWSRRLRGDIAISGGLPASEERDRLNASLVWQARRLREYRAAFSGGRVAIKWGAVTYLAGAIVLTIVFPPLNKPGDRFPLGPADYMMFAMGLVVGLAVLVLIASGRDIGGRTPVQLLRHDRVTRYNRRARRLKRLNKMRAAIKREDEPGRESGSRLGFETQVDPLAEWVSSWEMRSIAQHSSWIAAGIDERARLSLREKGVRGW